MKARDGPFGAGPSDGVGQVRRLGHLLAGIGARRPDQDAARVPRALQVRWIQDDKIPALLHRVVISIFDQVGVAMQNPQHLDAVPAK